MAVFGKPELNYLELHLTDHCNLNCKGCGHFCPVASPRFADVTQYELDMRRLSQLFTTIRTIRLLGGEPLLHPQAASFMTVTRRYFSRADIRIVTNGILLPKVSDAFWSVCRTTQTVIDLTVYPPLRNCTDDLRALCASKDVCLNPSEVEMFHSHMNLKGDSNKLDTFLTCRSSYYTPFLQNGRIYPCPAPALIHHFNKRFSYVIPVDTGIHIHSPGLSGKKILHLLDRPISNCEYCSFDQVQFAWATSNQRLDEWDVDAQRILARHEGANG